jgi:CheY-like chemotaxis protein
LVSKQFNLQIVKLHQNVLFMETLNPNPVNDSINVFLIGNNPIELSSIYDKLKEIKSRTFKTEIGFELKGLVNKIRRFSPSCILIDDNLSRLDIAKLIKRLSSDNKTKNIPITVIKNSNYREGFGEVQDYVLKESMTSDTLSHSILNSIKFKRMQTYVYKKYKRNKSRIMSLIQA